MRFSDLLTPARISTTLRVPSKNDAIEALGHLLIHDSELTDASTVIQVLRDREGLASTGVGDEVAIPHGRLPTLTQIVAAIAIAPDGVEFDSIDRRPVRIFVAVLAPDRAPGDHLRVLARVSRLLRDARVRAELIAAADPAAVLAILQAEEAQLR
ncbi:MAG: IIA-like nitrogen-regulatory protein PtsN [Myxococcaceae bacterium]|nr:IIA-like nitrogen-regulatory protein PtsN [Myxococcaceae bacterium]